MSEKLLFRDDSSLMSADMSRNELEKSYVHVLQLLEASSEMQVKHHI